MSIITLTTDFGTSDPFVGLMKGVILGIAPKASIVDLSHELPPQDLVAACLALEATIDYFPTGSIHMAVVDPGVGTSRAGVAVKTSRYFYVGPDNGLFTTVVKRDSLISAFKLTNTAYHLHPTSSTFHGRDVFAPVAAHLANGVPIDQLGEPNSNLTKCTLPQPRRDGDALEIHVIHVDHFGNLVTDLTVSMLAQWENETTGQEVAIRIGDQKIFGIDLTFADVPTGSPLAYIGSTGRLEIAIRNGNAAQVFNVNRGYLIQLLHTPRDEQLG